MTGESIWKGKPTFFRSDKRAKWKDEMRSEGEDKFTNIYLFIYLKERKKGKYKVIIIEEKWDQKSFMRRVIGDDRVDKRTRPHPPSPVITCGPL